VNSRFFGDSAADVVLGVLVAGDPVRTLLGADSVHPA
jgi:hypothetical protein